MLKFVVVMMERYGYIGILLLIFLENIFPPIPSEIILPFSGFMTTKTNLGVAGVIAAATIGSILGALVLYLVGSLLRAERLERVVNGKIGKALHFNMEHIRKAEKGFQRYGKLSVLFLRCVPIVRSLVSIPAGMAGMDMVQFFIFTAVPYAITSAAPFMTDEEPYLMFIIASAPRLFASSTILLVAICLAVTSISV